MKKYLSLLAGIFFALTGCTSQKIDDYEKTTPKMDIREFFNGDVTAWGVMFDISGKQDMHFKVAMRGTWKGNEGKLEEQFVYDDGTKSERVWTLHMNDDGTFTGSAADIIGGSKGIQRGNAMNMQYVLRAPHDGSTVDLDMDDWIYRTGEKTAINRVVMRKFGIKVGELMIAFTKK